MPDPITRLNAALVGRYRIESQLGEGGMATVYLADDLRHERKVALKVLKPELAAVVGADRFLAEIKTTANLQHPHILPLFDSGEAGGFLFYVMPYVEGESLQERLDREHQLPVEEAVGIALRVAGALQAAHEKGVVHRDVKPANILMAAGEPLVSDFGIALAVQEAGGGRLTETGLSLGTPFYMSPEQATSDWDADARSDIYSLGCVLYEMLVGEPPFTGRTAQAVLGKIVAGQLEAPRSYRPSVPPSIDAAIRRALERLAADRFSSAGDFARALGDPAFRHGATDLPAVTSTSRWRAAALVTSAAAIVAIASAVWAFMDGGATAYDVGLPYDRPVAMGFYRSFAVAPDGSFVIYEARSGSSTELWYQSLRGGEIRPIVGTEGAYGTPRISPDGTEVAFASDRQMWVVSVDGGTARPVAEAQNPLGGGWLADGRIFFADRDGRVLRWSDPETGPEREVVVGYCILPHEIPGREEIICGGGAEKLAWTKDLSQPLEIQYLSPEGLDQEVSRVALLGSDFRVVDDEYLVYVARDGDLTAARVLDWDALTVGRPVTLIPGIRRENYTGAGQFDISRDGTLVFLSGANAEVGELTRLTTTGDVRAVPVEIAAHLRYTMSPDERWLVSVVELLQEQELRAYDLRSGREETWDSGLEIGPPVWTPDGSRLWYGKAVGLEPLVLHSLQPNTPGGPEEEDLLPEADLRTAYTRKYLAEDFFLFGNGDPEGSAVVVDPTQSPPVIDTLGISSLFISVSPDQRWMAYQEQGGTGLYLLPWPERDQEYLVDPDAYEPQFRSATELIYWKFITDGNVTTTGANFYSVRLTPGNDPPYSEPELLMTEPRWADTPGPSYLITPGGDFIYLRAPAENSGHYFRVVPGWVDEMKHAVDAAGS